MSRRGYRTILTSEPIPSCQGCSMCMAPAPGLRLRDSLGRRPITASQLPLPNSRVLLQAKYAFHLPLQQRGAACAHDHIKFQYLLPEP